MSCVIPATTGIYRYRCIDKKYHPFIYMMVLDVVIETVYYLAFRFEGMEKITLLAVNTYMHLNFALFLYFVYVNRYLSKRGVKYLMATALMTGGFNYIYNGTLFAPFYYLLCFVCIIMLIVSIDILSRQIMEIKDKLVNNFWFWVSSFSILYNAFTLLIFALFLFAMGNTPNGKAIGSIQHFVNVGCYVFYAVAIWKIPQKRR